MKFCRTTKKASKVTYVCWLSQNSIDSIGVTVHIVCVGNSYICNIFCFYSCNSICSAFAHRLYVVSVDGVLSALDWEGQPVWSYQLAQPLFSSTLNYKVNINIGLITYYLAQPTQDTVYTCLLVCYVCMYIPSLVDSFCSVLVAGYVHIVIESAGLL